MNKIKKLINSIEKSIIEGDINKLNRFKDNKFEKLTLYSAIFSLNYYKGFSVLRTFNVEETGIYICNSANKLRKSEVENRQPYYSNLKQIIMYLKNQMKPKLKQNYQNLLNKMKRIM